jgi:hypothetical protein
MRDDKIAQLFGEQTYTYFLGPNNSKVEEIYNARFWKDFNAAEGTGFKLRKKSPSAIVELKTLDRYSFIDAIPDHIEPKGMQHPYTTLRNISMKRSEIEYTKHRYSKQMEWITDLLYGAGIIYRISGGFAARFYGSKRPLADIDIDVNVESFLSIPQFYSVISPYITFDGIYKDDNWECDMITLNYEGQEIDIVRSAKIFNRTENEWIKYNIRFDNLEYSKGGYPIINKKDLIDYKTKLSREVDVEDIKQIYKI